MTEFALPPKIIPALRRLRGHYDRKREVDIRDLIDSARVHVVLETEYDNWHGGTYGHDVIMFVPDELMALVDLDEQSRLFERVAEDLNKATPEVQNEYIRAVFIKPEDEADAQCQAAVPFTREPRARPEDVGLWKPNALRLFISHRDKHKAAAHELAEALEPYGVASFVAHDAIKPMKEWQNEILNGLMTMEVMLALITDDFHESVWTMQEVGYALGKGIPIICVKVGNKDPRGFIGSIQALRAAYEDIPAAAADVHRALLNEIGQEGRLKGILIESFISSSNFIHTIESLQRLTEATDRLTDAEFNLIVDGYEKNDQLHRCSGIHNRGNWFKRFLEDATGKRLEFNHGKIYDVSPGSDGEIPF